MFVTMVVAVCAALVHISAVLAVMLVPLIAAALVRTVRVVTREETARHAGRAAPGLFATFCQSVAILIAMIAVGITAVSFAGITGLLIAVMVVIHVFRAARVVYRPVTNRIGFVLRSLAEQCRAIVSRIKPVAILRWLQLQAVTGTLWLFRVCRRLFRQSWSGLPPAGVAAAKHHASRTEPL